MLKPGSRIGLLAATVLSLAIHAGLLLPWPVKTLPVPVQKFQVSYIDPPRQVEMPVAKPAESAPDDANPDSIRNQPLPLAQTPAMLPALPAPSAEEWQLASTYTLKNSKRYRHTWGQQVRSMMGTAVAGPDQGQVRLRIEIAPDGKITKVDELWSTSAKASELARKAIRSMPPLPPTPTGKPLVFEQTISFLPYETGWPPSYRYDCLPDPPSFKNPFSWDGATPQPPPAAEPEPEERSPDCHPSEVEASFEEEDSELQRQIERNRWGR